MSVASGECGRCCTCPRQSRRMPGARIGSASGSIVSAWPIAIASGGYWCCITSAHEQGISKAGNRRVRVLTVQLAWCWLRYQPHSALAQWFNARFAGGGSRIRRIGIVALARRLLIALWRYVEYGVIPEGATLKTRTV